MTDRNTDHEAPSKEMWAVQMQAPGGIDALSVTKLPIPRPGPGEALVRVHAAAITRDELDWPTDRLPAIPSYELAGEVVELGPGASGVDVGDAVFALTPFDRDGVAAEYAVVPAAVLARAPASIGPVEAAAVPMGALSAWQGLFVHGGLDPGQRVLIHGATGGVGHVATQLARWRGADVVATATGRGAADAGALGLGDIVDRSAPDWAQAIEPVDLVFDTSGGEALAGSMSVLRDGGRIVTIAEEPPDGVVATYFVVEPDGTQLAELARLVDEGALRPAIDATFPLADARSAFERLEQPGKRGKVVLEVGPSSGS